MIDHIVLFNRCVKERCIKHGSNAGYRKPLAPTLPKGYDDFIWTHPNPYFI